MSSSWGVVHQSANLLIAFQSSSDFRPVIKCPRALTVSRPIYYNTKALRSVTNKDTVVATDDNYGHKEVISVNPRLYDYLLANVREPKVSFPVLPLVIFFFFINLLLCLR